MADPSGSCLVRSSVDPGSDRASLLYIGGMERGGSTVLSAVLGSLSRFLPVGELRGIWIAVRTNELCGCGERFHECPFLSLVGERAFGGWHRVDLQRMLRADARFCRHRDLPLLLSPSLPPRLNALMGGYLETLELLYRSLHEVAGGRSTILDSTKDPPYAFMLRRSSQLDLRVLHLIRDSRAVAFSWSRSVPRPEYAHIPSLRDSRVDRLSPARASSHWVARNLLFHLLAARSPSLWATYESFVADPSGQVAAIARWCGIRPDEDRLAMLTNGEYESAPFHTVGGNRVRFRRGRVPIRLDREWLSAMPPDERRLVTALTLPLLLRYGYSLSPERAGTGT